MAERAGSNQFVAFLRRRGFLIAGVAVFLLVLIRSGSLWRALLASLLVNPVLPVLIAIVLGVHAARQTDPPKVFIDVPEIPDNWESRTLVDEIKSVHRRLVAAGSVRVELVRHYDTEVPDLGRSLLARGLTRFAEKVRHQVAEGVVDLEHDRMMIDYGAFAVSQIGACVYPRYSGGPLGREPIRSFGEQPLPLWFIAVLNNVVRASMTGYDEIDDVSCRQIDLLLDLTIPVPGSRDLWIPDWPDQAAVPMRVWLDGPTLRRASYRETPGRADTLTLRDLGVDVSGLDWNRTGTFRTPKPNHDAEPNLA
jgi:hypothetical protein